MFDAVFKAVADFSSVKEEARDAGAAMADMADKTEESSKRTGDATDEAGGKAKGFGAAFAGAFSATAIINFAGKVAEFSGKAVESFSNLEDATAAASVIFGTSMGKIQAQAQGAATSLGMSQAQVIDAANTFGTFGKSAGLAGDDLADFSVEMTQTAADMASFRGTTPEEAIQAVGAALRGETEPIRKYGVLMDDASLKAQAMKMGLIKTTKEGLTPQQKVLAAQALILQQTTDAQGDFARTSDSTANTQKALTAQTENLTAKIGGQLAPAFTQVRSVMLDALTGLSGALDWVVANSDKLVPALAGLGTVLLVVLAPAIWAGVAATWAWTVALLANPITWIVLGIGLLVAAIVWLVQNWDTATAWITSVWGAFVAWLGGVWDSIVAGVMGFGAQIGAFFTGLWDGIVQTAQNVWNGILAFFKAVLDNLFLIIIGPLGLLALWIIANWDRIQAGSIAVWDAIVQFFTSIPARLLAGLAAVADLAVKFGLWILAVKDAAVAKFTEMVDWVKGVPGRVLDALAAFGQMNLTMAKWILSVKDAAVDKFNDLVDWVKGVPERITKALGNLGDLLTKSGKALVDGFLDGIKGAWDTLVNWVKKGMTQLRGLWPFSPAKYGPFSGRGYVTYSGKAIGEDFAASLSDQQRNVRSGALDIVNAAAQAFAGMSSIDIGQALALGPQDMAAVSAAAPQAASSSSYQSTVATTNQGSGDTNYNLYLDGLAVGMDSRLEGAVRELVDIIGDGRRIDRLEGGGNAE